MTNYLEDYLQPWQIGDIIGNRHSILRFQIQKNLGEGGMGKVWLVKEIYHNTQYALKSPQTNGKENVNDFIKRFYTEAESWIMLPSHPNIVSCYFMDIFDGVPQILLEYVEGDDLSKLISYGDRTEIRSWRFILSVAIQISFGMAHAHKNKLIHRDLSPNNIMITSENSELRKAGIFAMVTDFGIM